MMLKCARCKKEKHEEEFRFIPGKGRYCSYCKSCEVDYEREQRLKANKRRYMLKTFRELCQFMEPADIDCLLFELKQIKDEVKGSESKRFS